MVGTNGQAGGLIRVFQGGGDQTNPAVAAVGTNFLVVCQSGVTPTGGAVRGNWVSGDGAVASTNGFVIGPGTNQASPVLAVNGDLALVVWEDHRQQGSSGMDIYGARFSGTNVLDPIGFPICTALGDQTTPTLACNGVNFFAAWTDQRDTNSPPHVFGTRVAHGGASLDDSGVRLGLNAARQGEPSVACNGADYFVAWSDHRDLSGPGIYEGRVRADGVPLDPDGLSLHTNLLEHALPAVSYGGAGQFLIVSQTTVAGTNHVVGSFLTGFEPSPLILAVEGGSSQIKVVWRSSAGLRASVSLIPRLRICWRVGGDRLYRARRFVLFRKRFAHGHSQQIQQHLVGIVAR